MDTIRIVIKYNDVSVSREIALPEKFCPEDLSNWLENDAGDISELASLSFHTDVADDGSVHFNLELTFDCPLVGVSLVDAMEKVNQEIRESTFDDDIYELRASLREYSMHMADLEKRNNELRFLMPEVKKAVEREWCASRI